MKEDGMMIYVVAFCALLLAGAVQGLAMVRYYRLGSELEKAGQRLDQVRERRRQLQLAMLREKRREKAE